METQDQARLKPLSQKDMAFVRFRWFYILVALIFAGGTLDQYSRHDQWFWAGLFCAISNSYYAVRAWQLKWRQRRDDELI